MNKGKVSIVIPTFNRAKYLPETLESILSQTYENWECIVVDDGSNDETENIMEDFLISDKRFSYYQRPSFIPKGANACRNYGFEKTNGEFIHWFDSDDIMLPRHIEELVDFINKHKLHFAVAQSENFDDQSGKRLKATYNFDREKHPITADAFAKQQIGWITDDFLAKKSTINGLKFNTQIKTDGDEYNFFSRYLLKTENGLYLDKILTKRRVHTESLSSSSKYTPIENLKKVCTLKFLTFLDIEDTDRLELKKWFLKGYMLNAFMLAKKDSFPNFLVQSIRYIVRYYSILKAFSFISSILLGLTMKKGYSLMKYSRT